MLVDVAIPVPLHHPFTYEVPEALQAHVQPGMRVLVPFHRRKVIGIILGNAPSPSGNMKSIVDCLDEQPIIAPRLLALCRWINRYYVAPIGEVCRAALPRLFFRQRALPTTSRLPDAHRGDAALSEPRALQLNTAQGTAIEALAQAVARRQFAAFLLHGVTGSGKTEVYLQTMATILADGKQSILLVPEIGLTPQLLGRVTSQFGEQVAVYHSGLTEAQRVVQWQRMAIGAARICVGTRSAVFAPFPKLGCIIVDEEHDASYKQEESPRYHARDVAIVRAREESAVAILGSATPSLESMHNAGRGKYQLATLSERATRVPMPSVQVVDMRSATGAKTATVFSEDLFAAMDATLAAGEQVLIFFNRRGFAVSLLCRQCGFVFRCPNCVIALTAHQRGTALQCHYCEYQLPTPSHCPQCQTTQFRPLGLGTERLEQMLTKRFPTARIARFDRDTSQRRDARESILRRMHRHAIDILIGTQMVTKGHDFPNVGLVGVIAADQSLYLPDFRAAERTFQLLMQVAGRAGRREKRGHVIIQTFTPDHYGIRSLGAATGDGFYREEEQFRRTLHYPPFGRLANIRISGNKEKNVVEHAEFLAAHIRTILLAASQSSATNNQRPATEVLGPSPAPFAKLAGRHRWQLLIKAPTTTTIQQATAAVVEHTAAHAPRGVHVAIDIDPIHLL